MRRIRYQVAASLDGYIAGPNGEVDWIVTDPAIDFGELFSQFDTALMGRRTYEVVLNSGYGLPPGMKTCRCFAHVEASRTSAGQGSGGET